MLLIAILLCTQYPANARVSFCAVGDIMLDRGIKRIIKKQGINYPFAKVEDHINQYDLAFCNLECPVSTSGASVGKIYCFHADTSFFRGVIEAGFNIFSLANNHIIDWGPQACLETVEIIEQNSSYACGAGENQKAARRPVIIRKNGLSFAFFAYVGPPLTGLVWSQDKPGPAQPHVDTIIQDIQKVRSLVNYIIVSLHWGHEYISEPTKEQINWAHRIIDAGADLIIGHHPHVLQSIECYHGRFILYSLGNFIFDQYKTYQRQTGIFSCVFKNGTIDSLAFTPVLLQNLRPHIVKKDTFKNIKNKLITISSGYNSHFWSAEESIFLTDSTYALSFPTPLTVQTVDNVFTELYRNRIYLLDDNDILIDSLALEPDQEVKDWCSWRDTSGLDIYAIIGPPNAFYGNMIVRYTITANKISKLWFDTSLASSLWKIECADIDGDSLPELCLASINHAQSSAIPTNRLHLYQVDYDAIHLTWQSNFDFLDFMICDRESDGLNDLITLTLMENSLYHAISYQWTGYGFSEYKKLATDVPDPWCSNLSVE